MTLYEFIKVHHPEVLQHFLEGMDSLLVLFVDDQQIIRYSNTRQREICAEVPFPEGLRADAWLCGNLGFDAQKENSDVPQPRYLRICHTDSTYRCSNIPVDGGYFIVGEKLETGDMDVIESMSLLTNQLTNLTNQLRQKNNALQDANATIEGLMRTDPLTGLGNRRLLYEQIEPAISLSSRHARPLSLIMTDIDHFKSVNDTYGHDGGDVVLKGFADLLTSSIRKEDLAIRFGGEEFLILLPSTADDGAFLLAERIRKTLENADLLSRDRSVTASFGVTQYLSGETFDAFLKRVDTALYEAKESGRNRTVIK